MTSYMEARVIQNIDDNENHLTATTSEYVKAGDGPFAGGMVLRTAAYRNFYSNYIPVSPGEDIYGEISTRLISGSGGLLYYGVERFDKDKNPIAGNTGIFCCWWFKQNKYFLGNIKKSYNNSSISYAL